MKTSWVTLHCTDQAILDTVLCALFVEDEETNYFEWKTLTVERRLADRNELYEKTHAKLVRLNERFITNFL